LGVLYGVKGVFSGTKGVSNGEKGVLNPFKQLFHGLQKPSTASYSSFIIDKYQFIIEKIKNTFLDK
jgi:hypothetical protein